MNNFIIVVITRQKHGNDYTKETEKLLNTPPDGYEVFSIMYNPETTSTSAAYRIVYKLADIEPTPIKTARKIKFGQE